MLEQQARRQPAFIESPAAGEQCGARCGIHTECCTCEVQDRVMRKAAPTRSAGVSCSSPCSCYRRYAAPPSIIHGHHAQLTGPGHSPQGGRTSIPALTRFPPRLESSLTLSVCAALAAAGLCRGAARSRSPTTDKSDIAPHSLLQIIYKTTAKETKVQTKIGKKQTVVARGATSDVRRARSPARSHVYISGRIHS